MCPEWTSRREVHAVCPGGFAERAGALFVLPSVHQLCWVAVFVSPCFLLHGQVKRYKPLVGPRALAHKVKLGSLNWLDVAGEGSLSSWVAGSRPVRWPLLWIVRNHALWSDLIKFEDGEWLPSILVGDSPTRLYSFSVQGDHVIAIHKNSFQSFNGIQTDALATTWLGAGKVMLVPVQAVKGSDDKPPACPKLLQYLKDHRDVGVFSLFHSQLSPFLALVSPPAPAGPGDAMDD